VQETAAGTGGAFTASANVQVAHTSAPSTDSYAENWNLSVPGNQAAGNYSETFTYTALANA